MPGGDTPPQGGYVCKRRVVYVLVLNHWPVHRPTGSDLAGTAERLKEAIHVRRLSFPFPTPPRFGHLRKRHGTVGVSRPRFPGRCLLRATRSERLRETWVQG